jgi:hypothetical protein
MIDITPNRLSRYFAFSIPPATKPVFHTLRQVPCHGGKCSFPNVSLHLTRFGEAEIQLEETIG